MWPARSCPPPPVAEVAPLRFQRPQLPPQEAIESYLAASRETRWFSNAGPCHEQLSERLAAFLGDGVHVVPTANATLGLMIALRSLIATSAASLVVVPSFTFPATAQAIFWCGLRPLWADVDRDGWHLQPEGLDALLASHGEDVAAVLACSTFGTAPAVAQAMAWERSCAAAGVPLLVDSAAGFGSRDERGALLGRQGHAEVFSFHATKPFAIGEGGAVVTESAELAGRISALTNFGFDAGHEVSSPFGLNAKMSEMHAAIGLAVLDGYDDVLRARRERAERLRGELEPSGYTFQAGARGSTWQFVPVLAPSAEVRDAALASAAEQEIEIRSYHAPLHEIPAFAGFAQAPLAVTAELASRTLSLPLANDLPDDQLDRVARLLCHCAQSPGRVGQPTR
jgi:dTDP-4-amino-4,6-dideoxygalactose transaminase